MKRVRDIMKENLVTVTYDTPVSEAAELLAENGISGAPVLDADGRLVGVVSTTDIAGTTARPVSERRHPYYTDIFDDEGIELDEDFEEELKVEDIMTSHVVSIEEDASLRKLLDVMLESRIHRVLVTRRGDLAGIVTTTDVMRAFRETLPAEVAAG